ncbi:hypothetical protein MUG84_26395 [Paenibacillus sp. KQZ6P-2]|uniref:Uncharacterized protein n=1 Tax=Paenibacillus mangrovi TaxID=2931978 RepID=A0A9X1WTW3_9BACL|nr:hypothetical protein [Paenibacillus mangrovi]MCJ8015202.1 hypothetical protein [Paenibacillus mangrovi]
MRIEITTTDEILVKRYIIFPLILSAYERDLQIINGSGLFKTPDVYGEIIEAGQKIVTEEIHSIKKAFKTRGIKVYEEIRTTEGIRAEYLCRGYHGNMMLSWSLIKAEAVVMMRKYLGMDISRFEKITAPEQFRNKY